MLTDLRARQIACDWHGGGGSALYALCSTGAINTARHDHDTAQEVNECYPSAHDETDFMDIQELEIYVEHHGSRGPVDGWSKLTW